MFKQACIYITSSICFSSTHKLYLWQPLIDILEAELKKKKKLKKPPMFP